MIRNILIDLDDTILDFKASEARAITETLKHFGIISSGKEVKLYSQINDEHWKKLEKGELTREQVLVGRFAKLFDVLGVNADAIEARHFYESTIKNCVDFIDGAIALLEELYKKCRLYLVSNGTAVVQDNRIKIAGIEKYFDGIFISQRLGYNKPSPLYFEKVFREILDFKKSETIILGDSLSSDMAGGRAVGIKTCWFTKNAKNDEKVDYCISNLNEFTHILSKIK